MLRLLEVWRTENALRYSILTNPGVVNDFLQPSQRHIEIFIDRMVPHKMVTPDPARSSGSHTDIFNTYLGRILFEILTESQYTEQYDGVLRVADRILETSNVHNADIRSCSLIRLMEIRPDMTEHIYNKVQDHPESTKALAATLQHS